MNCYQLIHKFRDFVKLLQIIHQLIQNYQNSNNIGQSGRFFGWFLGSFLKTGFPLMKNVLKPLAKSISIPLELTAAASATDAAIYKKMFGSGVITLINLNEEMNDTKIDKSFKESG